MEINEDVKEEAQESELWIFCVRLEDNYIWGLR
jgi:hypothetical protein